MASFLNGIWLLAPYLHHGAVLTLRDLLEPVDKQPKVFFRGSDVYNPVKVGFVTTGQEAERIGLTDECEREKLSEDVEQHLASLPDLNQSFDRLHHLRSDDAGHDEKIAHFEVKLPQRLKESKGSKEYKGSDTFA